MKCQINHMVPNWIKAVESVINYQGQQYKGGGSAHNSRTRGKKIRRMEKDVQQSSGLYICISLQYISDHRTENRYSGHSHRI